MLNRIRKQFSRWIAPKSAQSRFMEAFHAEYPRQLDILARYDAAETNDANRNHWSRVDSLSANASASPEIRKILRERSRYEIKNNSYGQGIVDTIANDTIGTGPRLQFCHRDSKVNKYIETQFAAWCEQVQFTEKCIQLRKAKLVDGEVFGMFGTNNEIDHAVKLDMALLETEQVASPYASFNENPADFVDGIRVNSFGTPVSYDVLRYHPGDTFCTNFQAESDAYDTVPARDMIHYFTPRRPRQSRAVPETSPALPLFAQLRRATLAVVRSFEIAAMIAGIMRTTNIHIEPQRDEHNQAFAPFQAVNFYPGMLMSLPEGWNMEQFKAECPPATYKMLKDELICEIIRCFCVPFNIGAGRSDGYNYASGRMDFQTYERSIEVERYVYLESRVLRPTFRRFLHELSVVDPFVGKQANILETKSKWLFDSGKHVDPMKEAQAQQIRLFTGVTSWSDEIGAMGEDAADRDKEGDPESEDDDASEDKPKAKQKTSATKTQYRMEQASETRRVSAIRKVCAGRFDKIEAEAIEKGWSPAEAELRVLKAEKIRSERPMPPSIRQGASGSGPNRNDVIAASALLALGKDEQSVGSRFNETVMNEAVSAQNRGYSLNRIVAECIRDAAKASDVHIPSAEGLRGAGMWDHYVNAQRELAGRVVASGSSFSTISLPGILSNVASKSLLMAYADVPLVFRMLFRRASQGDFKPAFSYRIFLENGRLKKIPSTGKIPATTLNEEQYERGLDTVGDMITITRKMIINDDLNALAKIPEMFGRLSAETIEQDGFDLLKKNRNKIFTEGKNRVKTNKKLNSDGLREAFTLFRQMTDKNGRPINVEPKYLLTPPSLMSDAWTLLHSMYVNQQTSTPTGDKNPWAGRFEHVDTPYISSTQGKGDLQGSDEEWYLLPKPTDLSLFSVSYLDGRTNPVIEQQQAAFDVLGVQLRVYHDFGINIEDEKGGVFSPGK